RSRARLARCAPCSTGPPGCRFAATSPRSARSATPNRCCSSSAGADDLEGRDHPLFLVFGEGAPEAVFASGQVEGGEAALFGLRFGDLERLAIVAFQSQVEIVRVVSLVVQLDRDFAGFE